MGDGLETWSAWGLALGIIRDSEGHVMRNLPRSRPDGAGLDLAGRHSVRVFGFHDWIATIGSLLLSGCVLCVVSVGLSLATPLYTWGQATDQRVVTTPATERWLARESAIRDVVAKTSAAVVAVTDDESVGSGVVVSRDGLVLTAGHVIMSGASEFSVYFPDGRVAKARPLGQNLNDDAGMLQIVDEGEWPFVEVGDGQELRRGDWVVAMGHSGGFDLGRRPPVRAGRIVRVEREAFTSDSPIIGGDSGGPLFDLRGQLVGIHSSIGESIAENRHVAIRIFLRDWDRLKSGERWGRLPGTPAEESEPREGGRPRWDDNNRSERAAPADAGVLGVEMDMNDPVAIVREVKPNSAAARVGLKQGDVVESFNGVAVESPLQLVELVSRKRAGDSIKLVVNRGGQKLEYQIILGQLETR